MWGENDVWVVWVGWTCQAILDPELHSQGLSNACRPTSVVRYLPSLYEQLCLLACLRTSQLQNTAKSKFSKNAHACLLDFGAWGSWWMACKRWIFGTQSTTSLPEKRWKQKFCFTDEFKKFFARKFPHLLPLMAAVRKCLSDWKKIDKCVGRDSMFLYSGDGTFLSTNHQFSAFGHERSRMLV